MGTAYEAVKRMRERRRATGECVTCGQPKKRRLGEDLPNEMRVAPKGEPKNIREGNVFIEGVRKLEEGMRKIEGLRKCEHGYVWGWCIRGCREGR